MKPALQMPLAVVAAALFVYALPRTAQAHGSMVQPQSRIYACAQGNAENPTDPACRAAKEVAGPQLFYDWMSINQANANDNHRAVVPDGQLCSGGNPTFRGLDLVRGDWQATNIAPDANGRFEFRFRGTAPHATREWAFYITPQGFNPATTALTWNAMEHFCSVGNTPLSADGTYHLTCTLPARTGRHVIYNTWQRSDSTEAFYTCMDVVLPGGTTPPPSTPQWTDAGTLTAQNALPTGTTVTLRVFNANGTDAERIATVLAAGQTSATQWPLRVGQEVNARAQFARIGVLQNGVITPTASASANHVFLTGTGRTHQVDITLPPTTPPPPTGNYDYVYPQGIGQYVPGQTVVKGLDDKLYGCRPYPNGAWCNVYHPAYYPGVGYAWGDAWVPY